MQLAGTANPIAAALRGLGLELELGEMLKDGAALSSSRSARACDVETTTTRTPTSTGTARPRRWATECSTGRTWVKTLATEAKVGAGLEAEVEASWHEQALLQRVQLT